MIFFINKFKDCNCFEFLNLDIRTCCLRIGEMMNL